MKVDFEVIKDGTTLNIQLGNELSVVNAPLLTEELSKYVGQDIEKVVFDASGLTFLSSSGIRSLLFAYQDIGHQPEVVFVNCPKEIQQVLDIVGLTTIIRFEEDMEKKELYRKRFLCDLSIGEAEQLSTERKKVLEQFAANNDIVSYSMRMGEEDDS